MAWNRKENRIADLEARNAHLLRELEKARGGINSSGEPSHEQTTVTSLRAELRQAKALLRETEQQLGAAQVENAQRTRRMVAYSNQAVSNAKRAARYRLAWKSARTWAARYRAELAEQQRVVDKATEHLFDAIGYQPDDRKLLDAARPARATTREVTAP
jgi:hypothetical protein